MPHLRDVRRVGQADVIATGDKRDLLPMGSFQGSDIVTAREAVKRLEATGKTPEPLDDSLSADLARAGRNDTAMTARFVTLADYAVAQGAQAILFTCSAFGPCIDAVKAHLARSAPMPVLAPNEAMIDEAMIDEAVALAHDGGGAPIGLVASLAPTLAAMPWEFPPGTPLRTAHAAGALEALQAGDAAAHDAAAAAAAARLAAEDCRVIALAQFSLARAASAAAARTGLPVLTTPESALRRLRAALAGAR